MAFLLRFLFLNIFLPRTGNHWQQNDFTLPSIQTSFHSSESLSYLGPEIWSSIPIHN